MPRITGKEAEGLMAAYAKVHAPKEEEVAIEEPVVQTPTEDIQEQERKLSPNQIKIQNKLKTAQNLKNATQGFKFSGNQNDGSLRANPINNKSDNTVTSKGGVERTVTKNNDGSINIQKGKDLDAETDDLIANTPTVKNSKFGNKTLEKSTLNPNVSGNPKAQDLLDRNPNTPPKKQDLLDRDPGTPPTKAPASGSVKFSGSQLKGLLDSQKGIGNSSGQQQSGNQQGQEKSFGQRQIEKAKMRGNPAAQGQDRMKRGTPVNQLFNKGGGNQQPQQQQPQQQSTQQPVKTVGGQGNRQRPVKTGGIQLGKAIRGGLGRLGSLAGRAVGAAKNAAGAVASGVKQGAQSAVSGAKRVAGGVADAATGNMTDFDKRGGKPQGVARVVAGAADKLTGDRTDLDKRGVTPLNAGQRAQQQQKPTTPPAAQAKAAPVAQAKAAPVNSGKVTPTAAQTAAAKADTTSPAAKAGLSSDMRAQAAANNAAFQAKRASQTPLERRNERLAKIKNRGRPLLRNEYDPTEDLFDDTVDFLISEGYVQDINEAIAVMSEPEFREGFDEGIQQVLTESSENNK